jgi:uncharacterized protein YndB with AHSA1/START domain
MERHKVLASTIINAPASLVYNILANYHDGHPQILPKPFFRSLEVLDGGIGAGTRIRFETETFGKIQMFQATITEPEPGRVLVEDDQQQNTTTTFIVDPLENGKRASVTFQTEVPTRTGLLGPVERLFTTLFLRKIYKQELALLAALAEQRMQGSPVQTSA